MDKAGLELVAENAAGYIGELGRADAATDRFVGGLDHAGTQAGLFDRVVTGAMYRVGAIVIDVLGQAARAAVDFLGDAISKTADLETTLSVLAHTSGASAEQMQAIRDEAVALGNDLNLPGVSAIDASEAMLELAKAGMTADEAMAAARGTLQLQIAAQTDAATAANVTSAALNAFGLEAQEANRIADLLAGGANASSASMTDLAQGLQQGGFAFAANRQSVDDLVTALAALTNVGLTGSDAGTALKNAMIRLAAPTDKASALAAQLGLNFFDAAGNMLPLPAIIDELNTGLAGMTMEQRNAALETLFLSDGMKAFIPLLDLGSAGFATLRDEVSAQGQAAGLAAAQAAGLNGAMDALSGAAETLQITIGQYLTPILTALAKQAAAVVGAIGPLVAAIADTGTLSTETKDALSGLLVQFGLSEDAAQTLASMVQTQLVTATTMLSDLWTTTLQPAIAAVSEVVETQVIPILADLSATAMPLVSAAAQILAGIWQQVLWPALKAVAAFLADPILPVLGRVTSWMAERLGPAVQQVANWFTDTFLPGAQKVGGFLGETFGPILGKLVELLGAALPRAGDVILAVLGEFFSLVQDGWTAVQRLVNWLLSLVGGLESVRRGVNYVVSGIQQLIDWFSRVQIPDWMIPGSPTPLELGLRGIARAIDQDVNPALRTMQALMPGETMLRVAAGAAGGRVQPAGMPVLPAAGSSSVTNQRTYQLNVQSQQSVGSVIGDFALMAAVAGG